MKKFTRFILLTAIVFSFQYVLAQNIDTPTQSGSKGLCVPEYSSGCSMGDGFVSFAVEEIQNYNSGCADNTGYDGWSEYFGLGPALLVPNETYDFTFETGYDNQLVSIWIDFNDDEILVADEIILFDFDLDNAGIVYTAPITIPSTATPGLHKMRARTNWQSSCDDPCESYGYGEAEDYMVQIGIPVYGSIGGNVTHFTGGTAIEDATIILSSDLYNYTTNSLADGSYLFENIQIGDYGISCEKTGYNPLSDSITIVEDVLLEEDFEMTKPELMVSTQTIEVYISPEDTLSELLVLENTGDGPVNWAASVSLLSKNSKDYLDLQFEYPVGGGGFEAGIESDGTFIYTTQWTGSAIFKYDLEGNFIEQFSIPGVSGLRDLAFDGTYFYGSAAIPVLWEMDFENKALISTIVIPTNCRAIAYNETEDAFYANNWSDPIVKFDKSGNQLGIFNTGPAGEDYYGFAFDFNSAGGPYLWGYAQTGASGNEIIQMQLPAGNETGFTLNIEDVLSSSIYGEAGGLFTQPNLVFSKWTLGGVVQNEIIWGLDLGDAATWLLLAPNAGELGPGENQTISVNFDAEDLLEGIYEANIEFSTFPELDTDTVQVTMNVITTGIENNAINELRIFPNPASDVLVVSHHETIRKVEIYNLDFQKVKSIAVNNTRITLNIQDLASGIYIVEIATAFETRSQKIVVQ